MRAFERVSFFVTLLILVAFALPARAGFRVPVDVDANALVVTSDEGEPRLALPGAGSLRQTGRPVLPATSHSFAVQRGETVVSARLEGGRWVRVPLDSSLQPLQALRPFEAEGFALERPFEEAVLSRAASFPPQTARLVADRVLRGQRIVSVESYPVRVESDGSIWILEGADLVVELGPAAEPDVVERERRSAEWVETTRNLLRGAVENPADVRVDGPASGAPQRAPLASAGAGPSLDSAPVEHLIITSEALRPAFERLAAHRLRMGMPSLVVTVEEIFAVTRQGADRAETIRNYVRDAYALWGVDYLLLGGDTDIVPTRYCRNTFYPSGGFTDVPTDLYYGGLDGNWNGDGDGLWGEHYRNATDRGDDVDLDAEVAVGRATVVTPEAAELFVDKVIAYEIPESNDWQTNALFASEVLFPLGWDAGEPLQLDGAFLSESLIDSAFGCPEVPWTIDRMVEIPANYPGSLPVSPTDVIDALDTGTHGLFHHVGHGFYFNMSVGPGTIVPADADGLTNAPNYFLLYSLNCSSSAFDFNCLNERFVNSPNGGAMASIGSSRAAFPSAAGPLQIEFYQDWLCQDRDRLGDVYSASRAPFLTSTLYNTVQRWTQMVYALIGDPAMTLYRRPPVQAQFFGPPSVRLGSGAELAFFVLDEQGQPMEGVTITAVKEDEDYYRGTTDASGGIALDFSPETLGTIELWASGRQIVPQSTTLEVTEGDIGVASVNGLIIDDDASAPSDGNGNGRVEAGESVVITPTVRNGADEAHPGGAVELSTVSPWVTVTQGLGSFPALAAGGASLGGDFVVTIDPGTPDGTRVELVFAVEDGAGRLIDDVEVVVVGAPQPEVVELVLDDGNDGVLQLGEQADVLLTLKNYGSGEGSAATATLSVVSGTVNVLDGDATFDASGDVLGTADNASDPFRISVAGSLSGVILEATIVDEEGRSFVHTFDVSRPGIVSGLDLFGAGSGRIQIAWTPSSESDVIGYRVYRRADGDPSLDLVTPDVILATATYLDDQLAPLTSFEYAVTAIDAGGLEGPLSSTLMASTNPPELDCFPLPLGLETSGALAISDVDPDGVRDMVIGADTIYVIDGECREPIDGDNDAQTFGPILDIESRFGPASIALGELDPSNPGLEIVAVNRDAAQLIVMDELGNILPGWPITLNNWAWGSPVVGDLDGDGTPFAPDNEIVINDLSGWTYAFHHDGSEVADGDGDPGTVGPITPRRFQTVNEVGYFENFGRTTPALYDVDGNGTLEILFGSKYQNINAPDYFYAWRVDIPGTNAAGWPKQLAPRSEFLSSPTIADLDRDGSAEIIAHCENDSIYVWELDGSNQPGFPRYAPTNGINYDSLTPSPAVGNFDADPDLEFVTAGLTRDPQDGSKYLSTLRVYDPDGSVLPGWPVVVEDLSESSPILGDLDGDGSLDVVFGIGGTEVDDALFAFESDGDPVRGFPIPINGFVRATPTLTDFDGNGTLDLALATWDRQIHVWDTGAPYDREMVPWSTFRGNVSRTGVYGQRTATAVPGDADVPSGLVRARLDSATPNPFNPQTKISFALADASSDVQLNVYDAQGRHVRTLAAGDFEAGRHDVVWSGIDGAGRRVASGVYFAVLEVDGDRVDSRKMALVK